MIMIEHMKVMQMPYLDIWLMLLSGLVLHRTNSSQLFWNRLFQKKKKTMGGGVEDILFSFEKTLDLFWFFSVPLEISVKTKLHPFKFRKIMNVTSIGNFKAKKNL